MLSLKFVLRQERSASFIDSREIPFRAACSIKQIEKADEFSPAYLNMLLVCRAH